MLYASVLWITQYELYSVVNKIEILDLNIIYFKNRLNMAVYLC